MVVLWCEVVAVVDVAATRTYNVDVLCTTTAVSSIITSTRPLFRPLLFLQGLTSAVVALNCYGTARLRA